MTQRRQRFHYYLWHRLRNSWMRLTHSEQHAVRAISPAWEPPRPALDEMRRPLRDNGSGEDFLFMHRRMIARVNAMIVSADDHEYPRVEGWKRVPRPEDTEYPVPEFPGSGLEEIKSVKYFNETIAVWERQYTNPDRLRDMTLGQLGSDIQFTIHNDIHMRWAAPSPTGYRPTTVLAENTDEKWDAPVYDYLGDTYASHVNPIFWKLHGWIDDRIEDWKRANKITGALGRAEPWCGPSPLPHHRQHATHNGVPQTWQEIDRIISASSASDLDGFIKPLPPRRRWIVGVSLSDEEAARVSDKN